MQKKNTRKPRRIKAAIADTFNADGINAGDTLLVEPATEFKDGDLVVLERKYTGEYSAQFIFNTTRRNAHGKPFKFFVSRSTEWRCGSGKDYLYETDEQNRRWKIIGKVVRKLEEAAQTKIEAKYQEHTIDFDWPYFDIHRDGTLTVEETKDVRPGQLILVKRKEGEDPQDAYFHRVCCVNGDVVRVTNDIREPHDEPLSLVIGRVVEINHDDCNHTKAEALRTQIRRLQADDDAITNCTQVYQLEKEIQALENPPDEEEEDDFEWPDEIDG